MSEIDKIRVLVNEVIRRKNIYREALERIRDAAKSWEGRKEAPYWNLGDIAASALKASQQPDPPIYDQYEGHGPDCKARQGSAICNCGAGYRGG